MAHPDPASTERAPDTPVYQLPERAELDPVSMAALALMDIVPPMLEPNRIDAMAVDLKAIATAVLDAVAGLPRVPQWTEARTVGGASRGGGLPDPGITVDLDHTDPPGAVRFLVEVTATEGGAVHSVAQWTAVPVADARQWFLAGLAACAAAENTTGAPDAGSNTP